MDQGSAERRIDERLTAINRARLAGEPIGPNTEFQDAATRLAVYGTLVPGRENHHLLERHAGTWRRGSVRGRLFPAGWGASCGAPGMVWEPDAEGSGDIEVYVLDAPSLEDAWTELDAFEGEEYVRILVPVRIDGARSIANIYALRQQTERSLEPPGM